MGWGCGLNNLSGESKLTLEFSCRLGTQRTIFLELHRCLGSYWEWRAELNRSES